MERNKVIQRFVKRTAAVLRWLLYSVAVSGIPLAFYLILTKIRGINEQLGLTELTVFFLGINVPVLVENVTSHEERNKGIMRGLIYPLVVFLILFIGLYGIIYWHSFIGAEMDETDLSGFTYCVKLFGGICSLFALLLRWFGGSYVD